MAPSALNPGVTNIPYFTPQHAQSPGTATAKDGSKPVPTLFKSLKIRGKTLRNRILVAPMCQYSTAESGPLTGALTVCILISLFLFSIQNTTYINGFNYTSNH